MTDVSISFHVIGPAGTFLCVFIIRLQDPKTDPTAPRDLRMRLQPWGWQKMPEGQEKSNSDQGSLDSCPIGESYPSWLELSLDSLLETKSGDLVLAEVLRRRGGLICTHRTTVCLRNPKHNHLTVCSVASNVWAIIKRSAVCGVDEWRHNSRVFHFHCANSLRIYRAEPR